jgi:hypothetical protein
VDETALRNKRAQSLISETKREATRMKITIKDQDHQWIEQETQETMAPNAMTKMGERTVTTEITATATQEEEIENGKMINIEIQIDRTTTDPATELPGEKKKIIDVIITTIEIMLMIEIKEDLKEMIKMIKINNIE